MNILNLDSYNNYIFIGDPHGLTMIYNILTSINTYNIEDNTVIIFAGDIGVGFMSIDSDKKILSQCNEICIKHNLYLCLIRGNHDNPNLFTENSPLNTSNIKLIEDYTIIKTYNKNILCIGGSISIDRSIRIKDKSYWENEIIKPIDKLTKSEIQYLDFNIDIVCAHSSPTFIKPVNESMVHQGPLVQNWSIWDSKLKKDNWDDRDKLNKILKFISKYHKLEYWIYGHFHDHFETDYNNTKFIGLDMCYSQPTFIKSRNNGMFYKLGPDILNINNKQTYNYINFKNY